MSETLPPNEGSSDYLRLLGKYEKLKLENTKLWKLIKDNSHDGEAMAEILAHIDSLIEPQLPVPKPRAQRAGKVAVENLAIITDVHYGEVVRADSTNGLAEYNTDIARERMDYLTDEVISYGKAEKIGKLVVMYGGDNISGMIHDDLERSNAEMVVRQTLDMGDITTEQLQRFAAAFPKVEVDNRSGNHGRPYRPMFFNRKQEENWDYVLAEIQKYRLANQKNVRFLTNKSFWNIIDVGNRKFLNMHGDTIKHANSLSLPWYSMWKELLKWMGMREQGGVPHFDDMNIGHYHHNAVIQMGNSTLRATPSVKGEDDYSFAGSRLPVPPGARILTVAGGGVKYDHIIEL